MIQYQHENERKLRTMKVSAEELLHIAKLADLNIKEDEIAEYSENLQEILNFADIINHADTASLQETVGVNQNKNVFRKDEVKPFDNIKGLMENAPEEELNMFKIPKVI